MANYNIEEIKKEVLRCKKILELSDIEVKLDKTKNNICYTKFIDKENLIITTNALVWSKRNWKNFKTIKGFIYTKEFLNKEEIKWLLLKEIYKESMNILL